MSEASYQPSDQEDTTSFDDRVDTHPEISNIDSLRILGRALGYIATVKGLFAAKFGLAAVALIPGLMTPWLAKVLIDQVVLQQPFNDVEVPFPPYFQPLVDFMGGMAPMEIMLTLSVIYVAMLILIGRGSGLGIKLEQGSDSATQSEGKLSAGNSEMHGVLGGLETLVHIRLTQKLSNLFRTRLFERLTRLPMRTIDDHRIGDSVYRVMYDAPDLPDLCFEVTLETIFMLIGVAVSLYFIGFSYAGVAPELVWISAAAFPIALLITLPVSALMRRVQQASRASGAATTNAIEESMSNLRAVQALGGMSREKKRVEKKSGESFRRYRHVLVANLGLYGIQMALSGILTLIVLVIVTNRIIDGAMTAGDYAVLIGLTGTVSGAGLALGLLWIGAQGQIAAIRRVFFFIDQDTEDARAELPALPPVRERVTFEDVGLEYANGHRALDGIDLELAVGELVAIVGPTGAGKTSLAYLLPGFYAPTTGRVLIDGHDITEVNTDSLRSQIAYVFQEHLLLNESIRHNLLMANPQASEADLIRACETARAMEFIDALPDRLDTVLGHAGDTLSVGQKQRLCIARGLVRDTRILILDEPTAALDPQTENVLVRALMDAAEDRLVIVIAHRLSTIRRADRIVFLEDGKIRDIGDHDTLMANPRGAYRRFVELQGG
jgi:ABC-type multidrug transport system fused ATPase/permease subunit